MLNLEESFKREFRKYVSANVGYKDVFSIPLPKKCDGWFISKGNEVVINNIEEPYYSYLNECREAYLFPKGVKLEKRKIDKVNRVFLEEKEAVTVPSSSLAVLSDVNIKLPFRYKSKEDGFAFVDTMKLQGKVFYIYVIPKKYLYRVNVCALTLSVNKPRCFYGYSVKTWKHGLLTLAVVPYKHGKDLIGTKVLETKRSLDFKVELGEIIKFWEEQKLIPNVVMSNLLLEQDVNLTIRKLTSSFNEFGYDAVDFESIEEKEKIRELESL